MGLWVGGGGSCYHHGMDHAQGGGFFLLEWVIFYPIIFEFVDEAIVQADSWCELGT